MRPRPCRRSTPGPTTTTDALLAHQPGQRGAALRLARAALQQCSPSQALPWARNFGPNGCTPHRRRSSATADRHPILLTRGTDQRLQAPLLRIAVYRMAATAPPYARPKPFSEGSNAPGCVSSHRCRRGAASCCRQRAACSEPSRLRPKPLKMVTPERAHPTTIGDLLANRWQTAIRSHREMEQVGSWTRPGLWVCGGAPRRNRTGDPILTMDRQPSAVLSHVFAGRMGP